MIFGIAYLMIGVAFAAHGAYECSREARWLILHGESACKCYSAIVTVFLVFLLLWPAFAIHIIMRGWR